ncbi:uncharacterized protein [Littorina saxatilis]|uniref:uncharacterized protein n=1 Tax=Littorina saxatilis TaxID=31220 RepID=UPI0038B60434
MLTALAIWEFFWVATTCRAEQPKEELFTHSNCPPVPEGDTGCVSFYVNDKVNIPAHRLLIFVKQNEGPDILHCYHVPPVPGVHCTAIDDRFKTKGLVDEKLTLVIPNVTEDVQGMYVLRVMAQEISRHQVDCNFTILKTGDDRTDQDQINPDVAIVVVITLFTAVSGLLFALFMTWILRRRQHCSWCGKNSARTHGSPGSKIHGNTTDPPSAERENESLMAPEANDSEENNVTTSSDSIAIVHAQPEACDVVQRLSPEDSSLLFSENVARPDGYKLLQSYGSGSFLIRPDPRDRSNYRLAVNCSGEVRYFQIVPQGTSFRLLETGNEFTSLCDLVAHYKENDITNSNNTVYDQHWGRLTTLFINDPRRIE